jgi:hypothetical protein
MNWRLSFALLVALSACTSERTPSADAAAATPPDNPAQDVPPATAPTTPVQPEPQPVEGAQPLLPPSSLPDGDRGLARFDGYGDIRFGTPAEKMAEAWGGELVTLGKDANPSCYFMTPKWVKVPAEFAFMIGDGEFARFGTESEKFVAPGGGKVGMSKSEIAKFYAGRIEERPHKYTDGQYLRVRDTAGGAGVLLFETDGKGDAAKVTEWRVGVPPEVDYVEGCA